MIYFPEVSTFLPKKYILSDRGIMAAAESGALQIKPLVEGNIQPATLDVCIGKAYVYGPEEMAKAVEDYSRNSFGTATSGNYLEFLDRDPTTKYAKVYPDIKDEAIVIPPGAYAEVFLHESIGFDPSVYEVEADLRSSRGRLGLSLGATKLLEDERGKYLSVHNLNPNPIVLYGQSKFAQIFFYPNREAGDGYLVTDPIEAKNLAESSVAEGKADMSGSYMVFGLGENVLKFRKNLGEIDTNNLPSKDRLYEEIKTDNGLKLGREECIIAQLTPKLKLGRDLGIHLLHSIPYRQRSQRFGINPGVAFLEGHSLNAGWVDPGYEGNVTAHPFMWRTDIELNKGCPIALGVLYKYSSGVQRGYGSEGLGSHYQGSSGEGANN